MSSETISQIDRLLRLFFICVCVWITQDLSLKRELSSLQYSFIHSFIQFVWDMINSFSCKKWSCRLLEIHAIDHIDWHISSFFIFFFFDESPYTQQHLLNNDNEFYFISLCHRRRCRYSFATCFDCSFNCSNVWASFIIPTKGREKKKKNNSLHFGAKHYCKSTIHIAGYLFGSNSSVLIYFLCVCVGHMRSSNRIELSFTVVVAQLSNDSYVHKYRTTMMVNGVSWFYYVSQSHECLAMALHTISVYTNSSYCIFIVGGK